MKCFLFKTIILDVLLYYRGFTHPLRQMRLEEFQLSPHGLLKHSRLAGLQQGETEVVHRGSRLQHGETLAQLRRRAWGVRQDCAAFWAGLWITFWNIYKEKKNIFIKTFEVKRCDNKMKPLNATVSQSSTNHLITNNIIKLYDCWCIGVVSTGQ